MLLDRATAYEKKPLFFEGALQSSGPTFSARWDQQCMRCTPPPFRNSLEGFNGTCVSCAGTHAGFGKSVAEIGVLMPSVPHMVSRAVRQPRHEHVVWDPQKAAYLAAPFSQNRSDSRRKSGVIVLSTCASAVPLGTTAHADHMLPMTMRTPNRGKLQWGDASLILRTWDPEASESH